MSKTLIPCSNCGAEVFDADETTAEIERDCQFAGKSATHEVPAKRCPECGEVTPL